MAKTNKIIQSLNSGELSPKMDARIDQDKYNSGNQTMENFIPLIYGGAEERPGTEYINSAISSVEASKSLLIGFEHSVDDTYVLEFGNQAMRVFKDGARVFAPSVTEDLSDFDSATGDSSLIAHWKMDDNLADQVISDDSIAETHDGVTSVNDTDQLTTTNFLGTANKALDLNDTDFITVPDNAAFSFGDGTDDSPFSIMMEIFYVSDGAGQGLIAKNITNGQGEWSIFTNSDDKIIFSLEDESEGTTVGISPAELLVTNTWYFIVCTYDGRGGGGAWKGMKMYIGGSLVVTSSAGDLAGYVAMEALASDVTIGISNSIGNMVSKVDNVAAFNKELSAQEIAGLASNPSTTPYEVTTPYLTADLFSLKFEQSADVMFITHPSYEERKLSRFGDASWTLEVAGLQSGPFRDQNTDTAQTIKASSTIGSVTLTASGHSPFIEGLTAGHSPSGSLNTSKSTTGALFKLVQAVSGTDASIGEDLDSAVLNAVTTTLAIAKGVTWDLTTNGTWGTAGPSTIVFERSYDAGTTYETVHTVTSKANKNTITSGTEENADAIYRARVFEAGGTGIAEIQYSIRDTSHIGIVQITSVTNPQVAVGTVVETLASIDPTHRWSEGSFSNFRGWPIDVTISPEERLTFVGNLAEPLNQWGSVIGDFTNFREGSNDDDAVTFTLIGSGQQNRIRWVLSKDTLVIGTVGGEHLLGASKVDEAMTPSNVRARLQTTYGSEDIAAIAINRAILFIQRGGKKVREFLYNFEQDSHKADDLTVFADHITGTGITDMAFQRTPDPTLWCIRGDGQIAVLTYERDQNVFAWYRVVTTDSTANSVIESVAVIYGGAGNEDEVYLSVLRQIDGGFKRSIERFAPRLLPDSASDYKFLDSYITDTGGDVAIPGLGHLEGETVQVLGDGLVQATKVVSGGSITAATAASKYQVGLGYTATVTPMKINLGNLGLATTKRINRAITNVYKTIGGEVSPNGTKWESIPTGTSLFTGTKELSIPGGYSRAGNITIRQTQPLPITVLSLTLDMGASND